MTVLTVPSTGVKLTDKVPLVDGDRNSTPQPYNPKVLESGVAAGLNIGDPVLLRKLIWHLVKFVLITIVFVLMFVVSFGALCKAVNNYNSFNKTADLQEQRNVAEELAAPPYKSYTSYAAAESDMLSMPSSPAVATAADDDNDYDATHLNGMDDVYRKLVGFGHRDTSGNVISMFNEDFEIEPMDGNVPPVIVTKSARFIHDFSVNVTGIVDVEGQRCFVMPLVRNSVSPPASLYDLLFKMSSGYYSMDIKKIMSSMRVVKPAVTHLSDYGLYISKDCADYSTFKLEKATVTTTDE